jgi:alpha-N-arabinofuranosidase
MKCSIDAFFGGAIAKSAGCSIGLMFTWTTLAVEFHVTTDGNDANPGNRSAPFRTIQRAADLAQPGDAVTVHQGTYRERINPMGGGVSDQKRIVYQAARGEKVEIKGSEVVKGWILSQGDVWKVTLPNSFFGTFNPYGDRIHGDWFNPKGRPHHTGAIYLNGDWLVEAATLEEVMSTNSPPKWLTDAPTLLANTGLWFAQVDGSNTTIWAQFKGVNPNAETVEMNVRQTIFYPEKPGMNFITVRGFRMEHAATPWAPPTAQQIGLIGTHWSKGWIIESNFISYSVCSGISLGKYGDNCDNTSAESAEGYVKTVERALENNWNRGTIGHHVVRDNVISHCEQAGIVGSLGAAFSIVEGNEISDIHVRRLFTGAEMAAIKFHGAIDSMIRNNHIHRSCLGLWLDWMAQGTRVSANAFYENGRDLFVEVNHGPFVVDNNLFLSSASLLDMSEGGAYVHNLFTGTIISAPEFSRQTPYHPAHSTAISGLTNVHGGDCRFYNNIFAGPTELSTKDNAAFGLASYNKREFPLQTGGNVYYAGALPYAGETNCVRSRTNLNVRLLEKADKVTLRIDADALLEQAKTCPITTALLGKARVADVPYDNADGSVLIIDFDFSGKERNGSEPTPGPFEKPGEGSINLQLKSVRVEQE